MSAPKIQAQQANQGSTIDINTPYTPRKPSPVISMSVNHPIATMIRKIKNFLIHKQTLFSTTFTIKITPIVAIVSLFGLATLFGGGITTAFNFGKTVEERFLAASISPTPAPTKAPVQAVSIVSKEGTIQPTYQFPPSVTGELSGPPQILHYILQSRNGGIIFLHAATGVSFLPHMTHHVLITGSLDTTKNTLTVAKQADIEVLQ